MSDWQPVIVGAGPAGVRAAQTLLRHGVRPVVVDEGERAGGQIYRRPPQGRDVLARKRYGFEWRRAVALHEAGDAMAVQADYRPRTLVWNGQAANGRAPAAPAQGGVLDLMQGGRAVELPYDSLLIATGATDRLLPFEGWTRPGVYTLGGAQVALKYQDTLLGPRIVFAGTGPLLYLVAYQYAKAGAKVAAVLDTTPLSTQVSALPGMLARPSILAKGIYYTAWLRAHGVPMHHGVRLEAALGEAPVAALRYSVGGRSHEIPCDALAVGFGLRSETQLADLLDCDFRYDTLNRAWLPVLDAEGRASVAGVYLAGDGAGIGGADHAEWAGELAALAMLSDRGVPVAAARQRWLARRLDRSRRFRQALERAFPLPDAAALVAQRAVLLCRCEEISTVEANATVRVCGIEEMNRLKALSRVGMGLCQGRMCQAGAAEFLAHACGRDISQVGRLRAQAPIKPLPLSAACSGAANVGVPGQSKGQGHAHAQAQAQAQAQSQGQSQGRRQGQGRILVDGNAERSA
ncbi:MULTISPECIES: FAD/NAD(P)-binding oxidoreductase [unclassified Achromobacter]|uniref:NAD(P)/FAD-dependent oxidoreductase n=1 Tax=unclassified Achromobacter TaxID=2626865 RepID=UPI000B5194E6|nr:MULTISPECIES: FAD/NAD(P)-binding oxidoreductase [unclassified Achromobacter]OWT73483.1 FAD/NAD(P)-binding oxidoreductase [Achromobacter sp. HZ34]OWT79598.1 FAD/NAD(P)-binding oxidoreductase [Achromobacter sp. HZ28]